MRAACAIPKASLRLTQSAWGPPKHLFLLELGRRCLQALAKRICLLGRTSSSAQHCNV